jgi:hypothetical protein
MKRLTILNFPAATLLLFGLAACGGQGTAAGIHAAGMLTADYQNALPVESQLILGTLLLENSENAVTADQAAELLPLYQMLQDLESRDTAATQEKGGLIEQIQETMTKEQIQAISAMQLKEQDAIQYVQKAGLIQAPQQSGTPAASGSTGGNFPSLEAGPPAGFEGGAGQSGPSGGGGFVVSGNGQNPIQNLSAEQITTIQAVRSGRGGQGNSTALLEALLQLLESKQTA